MPLLSVPPCVPEAVMFTVPALFLAEVKGIWKHNPKSARNWKCHKWKLLFAKTVFVCLRVKLILNNLTLKHSGQNNWKWQTLCMCLNGQNANAKKRKEKKLFSICLSIICIPSLSRICLGMKKIQFTLSFVFSGRSRIWCPVMSPNFKPSLPERLVAPWHRLWQSFAPTTYVLESCFPPCKCYSENNKEVTAREKSSRLLACFWLQ